MKRDPALLSRQENYKLLIGSILPRPIAFVSTLTKDGVVNAAPFSFFNVLTADPPLIGISVGRKPDGSMKDTSRNAVESGEFVVHVVNESIVEAVNETAANFPPNESEIEHVGLTLIPSEVVRVPSIKESPIRLECKLEQRIALGGNGEEPATDFLIGRVVQYVIDDQLYEDGKVKTESLQPVSRLAGSDYSTLGDIFSIPRPTYNPNA